MVEVYWQDVSPISWPRSPGVIVSGTWMREQGRQKSCQNCRGSKSISIDCEWVNRLWNSARYHASCLKVSVSELHKTARCVKKENSGGKTRPKFWMDVCKRSQWRVEDREMNIFLQGEGGRCNDRLFDNTCRIRYAESIHPSLTSNNRMINDARSNECRIDIVFSNCVECCEKLDT